MIHFVTTRPRAEPCPRCGRLQWIGYAEGVPYRLDPAPLTAAAELAARLTRRASYRFTAGVMASRTPENINADSLRGRPIVFATHRCAIPVTATDIDPTFLPYLARVFAKFASDGRITDIELNTFGRLHEQLGARVLDTDAAPF